MSALRQSLTAALPRTRPRPQASVRLAAIGCPPLLLASAYGLWLWTRLPLRDQPAGAGQIVTLLALIILPVAVFIYLLVKASQRLEYLRLSGSYQTRIDQLQKRLHEQEDLLHVITDEDPDAIAIFDKDNRFWFCNAAAAAEWRIEPKQAFGHLPSRILPADLGVRLEAQLSQLRDKGKPIRALDQRRGRDDGAVHFSQTSLDLIKPFAGFSGGVLLRSEDVTTLVVERERRENMLQQLINTMVAVVDRRDPYAAGHSARVGQLSRAIAEELLLPENEIEAAAIAGSLMNFGKVLVPRQILTKTTVLTPDELQRVRDSILISADILSIINFAGPVVPTLRQVLERYDGSGTPNELQGDAILPTAYTVMVANAFVALVSPRAHRPSLDNAQAVAILTQDAGRLYDVRVVKALANCLDNPRHRL